MSMDLDHEEQREAIAYLRQQVKACNTDMDRLHSDNETLCAQLKEAYREIQILRDTGRIAELERELEPLRRLRDAMMDIVWSAPLPSAIQAVDVPAGQLVTVDTTVLDTTDRWRETP